MCPGVNVERGNERVFPYGHSQRVVATMASKSGVWVFYYLQGEDGDSVENPNAFNVRQRRGGHRER